MSESELSKMPHWQQMQYKSFRAWCNHHLAPKGPIEDLASGFEDGLLLGALVENLSGKKVPNLSSNVKTKIHKVQNLYHIFNFIKEDIKLDLPHHNIQAEDIVDKNLKLVLGLIWQLILHYQLVGPQPDKAGGQQNKSVGIGDARFQLMQRLKKHIAGPEGQWYDPMPLRNFDLDFQDGKVFSAVVSTADPKLGAQLRDAFNPNDNAGNLDRAFDVLQKEFGVPRLLDPKDMVSGKPDDKSVMTYVAIMLDKVDERKLARRQKREEAAKAAAAAKAAEEAQPNASKSYAHGPGLEPGNEAGKPLHFEIVSKNKFDQPTSQGGAPFKVEITGPDGKVPATVKDNGDGTYPVEYTAQKPGDYTVSVTLDGQPIKNSPYKVTIGDSAAAKAAQEEERKKRELLAAKEAELQAEKNKAPPKASLGRLAQADQKEVVEPKKREIETTSLVIQIERLTQSLPKKDLAAAAPGSALEPLQKAVQRLQGGDFSQPLVTATQIVDAALKVSAEDLKSDDPRKDDLAVAVRELTLQLIEANEQAAFIAKIPLIQNSTKETLKSLSDRVAQISNPAYNDVYAGRDKAAGQGSEAILRSCQAALAVVSAKDAKGENDAVKAKLVSAVPKNNSAIANKLVKEVEHNINREDRDDEDHEELRHHRFELVDRLHSIPGAVLAADHPSDSTELDGYAQHLLGLIESVERAYVGRQPSKDPSKSNDFSLGMGEMVFAMKEAGDQIANPAALGKFSWEPFLGKFNEILSGYRRMIPILEDRARWIEVEDLQERMLRLTIAALATGVDLVYALGQYFAARGTKNAYFTENRLQNIRGVWINLFQASVRGLKEITMVMEERRYEWERNASAVYCDSCGQAIKGPYLTIMGKKVHKECLRCQACGTGLAGQQFFELENEPHCGACIEKISGKAATGGSQAPAASAPGATNCARCKQAISGRYLTALDKQWHADCFTCHKCNKKISGGFADDGGQPLCADCAQ